MKPAERQQQLLNRLRAVEKHVERVERGSGERVVRGCVRVGGGVRVCGGGVSNPVRKRRRRSRAVCGLPTLAHTRVLRCARRARIQPRLALLFRIRLRRKPDSTHGGNEAREHGEAAKHGERESVERGSVGALGALGAVRSTGSGLWELDVVTKQVEAGAYRVDERSTLYAPRSTLHVLLHVSARALEAGRCGEIDALVSNEMRPAPDSS